MNEHTQAQILTLRNQAKAALAQGDSTASQAALRQALALAQQDRDSLLYGAVCLELVEHHASTLSHLEIHRLLREAVRVFQAFADQGGGGGPLPAGHRPSASGPDVPALAVKHHRTGPQGPVLS